MKDGYYWCENSGEFEIIQIIGNEIFRIGYSDPFPDWWFTEIGDYIETPEKYKG